MACDCYQRGDQPSVPQQPQIGRKGSTLSSCKSLQSDLAKKMHGTMQIDSGAHSLRHMHGLNAAALYLAREHVRFCLTALRHAEGGIPKLLQTCAQRSNSKPFAVEQVHRRGWL